MSRSDTILKHGYMTSPLHLLAINTENPSFYRIDAENDVLIFDYLSH